MAVNHFSPRYFRCSDATLTRLIQPTKYICRRPDKAFTPVSGTVNSAKPVTQQLGTMDGEEVVRGTLVNPLSLPALLHACQRWPGRQRQATPRIGQAITTRRVSSTAGRAASQAGARLYRYIQPIRFMLFSSGPRSSGLLRGRGIGSMEESATSSSRFYRGGANIAMSSSAPGRHQPRSPMTLPPARHTALKRRGC